MSEPEAQTATALKQKSRPLRRWLRAARWHRVLFVVLAVLLTLALLLGGTACFLLFCPWGLWRGENPYTMLENPVPATELRVQSGGVTYQVDEDVVNILILGVDHVDENTPGWDSSFMRGGQADTLVLCSYNTRTNKAVLLPLSRHLQAPMGFPTADGKGVVMIVEDHLCLAHAYGSNPQQSAQLTKASVSALLGGIPIHRYVSMKMEAVRHITDFVGGVPVWVLPDFEMVAGEETGTGIILDGAMAEQFVRGRSMGEMTGRDLDRMVRQRLYVFSLIDVVKTETKANPFFALSLYGEISPYLSTDLSFREMARLASGLLLQNGEVALEVMTGDEVDQLYTPEAGWIENFVRQYCLRPVG